MKTISRIFVFGLLGLLGLAIHPACAQCGAPANLNVSHITGSAATVTWDYDTAVFGEPSGFFLLLAKTAGTDTMLFYPGSDSRRQTLTGLDEHTSPHKNWKFLFEHFVRGCRALCTTSFLRTNLTPKL